MKKNFMLANGWGIVYDENGNPHWVFIPLWDPVKFNKVGRAIFATMVIKQHIGAIANKEALKILKSVVKEQGAVVSGGYAKDMEDGGWCGTPYPHHIPGFGGGPIGPDPDNPVYLKGLGAELTGRINAKAAISILGAVLKDKAISQAAELI